jgi:hypothetical protein
MPRKLEAGGTYDYVLETDRDVIQPPTFKLAILSSRDDDKLSEHTAAWRATTDRAVKSQEMRSALTLAVKGWSNMGREFSIEALEDLLTKRELFELLGDATMEGSLNHDERKKYESQQQSETG